LDRNAKDGKSTRAHKLKNRDIDKTVENTALKQLFPYGKRWW
jgi:hypothetical protein